MAKVLVLFDRSTVFLAEQEAGRVGLVEGVLIGRKHLLSAVARAGYGHGVSVEAVESQK